MVHPIIDEYYNHNPYHRRSSKFVHDKGLITNEKGNPNNPVSPSGNPAPLTLSLNKSTIIPASKSNPHNSAASTLLDPISPALTPAREISPLRHESAKIAGALRAE
ncbi:hypothetical protein M7I_4729 [Glarea lozoyensis 74030]|uniref:Uncharacterized protein n=1 Tax=Glarea lozoyensis (strain ATCC 74030 / MF5533) TaxID=1104152 RepID=H0EPY9_GLAL7|nr:hypothetical protein M7I_4729 [Glarea lozoyensis 74030]